jgi:hypothetical protein
VLTAASSPAPIVRVRTTSVGVLTRLTTRAPSHSPSWERGVSTWILGSLALYFEFSNALRAASICFASVLTGSTIPFSGLEIQAASDRRPSTVQEAVTSQYPGLPSTGVAGVMNEAPEAE